MLSVIRSNHRRWYERRGATYNGSKLEVAGPSTVLLATNNDT